VSQHISPSSYLVFCTGIFKWLQHSWTHICRSYVHKNVEVGNYKTLEGYLSSDSEVLACFKSSDKTLGSKIAWNLLNECLYHLSFLNMLLHTSANRRWPRFYYTGEHKFFPCLQTFITRKLCGIQTGAHVEVY
jgi:hypothetical protein